VRCVGPLTATSGQCSDLLSSISPTSADAGELNLSLVTLDAAAGILFI